MKACFNRTWRVLAGLFVFFLAALPLPGPLQNGNFAAGLTGWTVDGYAATGGADGNVVPVNSSAQALIASGDNDCPSDSATVAKKKTSSKPGVNAKHAAGLKKAGKSVKPNYTCGGINIADVPVGTIETDLNLPSGAIHAALPNNGAPTEGSAMWQTFTATAGQTISFYWNFATNEDVPTDFDAALYSLQVGGNPAQVFELADDSQSNVVNRNVGNSSLFGTGDCPQNQAECGMTGYQVVNIPVTVTGTYTLGFISMQTEDDSVSSGTFISSVQVGAPQAPLSPPPTATPVPPSLILGLIGLAFMALYFGRRIFPSREAA